MKEVTIDIEGTPVVYKIRKLTYGEWIDVVRGSGKTQMIGGSVPKQEIDMMALIDAVMKKVITGTPDYHELDVENGTKLQTEVVSYCGLGGASFQT